MRTNEPTESQPWRPLGEKVTPKSPTSPAPADTWKPVEGSKHVQQNGLGQVRTAPHYSPDRKL